MSEHIVGSGSQKATGTSVTASINNTALRSDDCVLLAAVCADVAGTTHDSVTYGGVALTKISEATIQFEKVSYWYLKGATIPLGANDLVATIGSSEQVVVAGWITDGRDTSVNPTIAEDSGLVSSKYGGRAAVTPAHGIAYGILAKNGKDTVRFQGRKLLEISDDTGAGECAIAVGYAVNGSVEARLPLAFDWSTTRRARIAAIVLPAKDYSANVDESFVFNNAFYAMPNPLIVGASGRASNLRFEFERDAATVDPYGVARAANIPRYDLKLAVAEPCPVRSSMMNNIGVLGAVQEQAVGAAGVAQDGTTPIRVIRRKEATEGGIMICVGDEALDILAEQDQAATALWDDSGNDYRATRNDSFVQYIPSIQSYDIFHNTEDTPGSPESGDLRYRLSNLEVAVVYGDIFIQVYIERNDGTGNTADDWPAIGMGVLRIRWEDYAETAFTAFDFDNLHTSGGNWIPLSYQLATQEGVERLARWSFQNWYCYERDGSRPERFVIVMSDYRSRGDGANGGIVSILAGEWDSENDGWIINTNTMPVVVRFDGPHHMHTGGIVWNSPTDFYVVAARGDSTRNNAIQLRRCRDITNYTSMPADNDTANAYWDAVVYEGHGVAEDYTGLQGLGFQFVGCCPGPLPGQLLVGTDHQGNNICILTIEEYNGSPVVRLTDVGIRAVPCAWPNKAGDPATAQGQGMEVFYISTPTPNLPSGYTAIFRDNPELYDYTGDSNDRSRFARVLKSDDGYHWAQVWAGSIECDTTSFKVMEDTEGWLWIDRVAIDTQYSTGIGVAGTPKILGVRPLVLGCGGTNIAISSFTGKTGGNGTLTARVLGVDTLEEGLRASLPGMVSEVLEIDYEGLEAAAGCTIDLTDSELTGAITIHLAAAALRDPDGRFTGCNVSMEVPGSTWDDFIVNANIVSTGEWYQIPVSFVHGGDAEDALTVQFDTGYNSSAGAGSGDVEPIRARMYLAIVGVFAQAHLGQYPIAVGATAPDEYGAVSGFACEGRWGIGLAVGLSPRTMDRTYRYDNDLASTQTLYCLWDGDSYIKVSYNFEDERIEVTDGTDSVNISLPHYAVRGEAVTVAVGAITSVANETTDLEICVSAGGCEPVRGKVQLDQVVRPSRIVFADESEEMDGETNVYAGALSLSDYVPGSVLVQSIVESGLVSLQEQSFAGSIGGEEIRSIAQGSIA